VSPAAAATARRTLRAVVIGPGARRALGDGFDGTIELVFGRGGYVRCGERWVLLAPARSPVGPLSVLVAGLVRGDLVPGAGAAVSEGALVAGSLRIDLAGARVPPPLRAGGEPAVGWGDALAAALGAVAPAPDALVPGLGALAASDLEAAVAQLAGRGEGLTPAGDDVLAGFAGWRWARGAPIALPAQRCAPLGRGYLRCAERGELPSPVAVLLSAIRAGDAPAAARRAGRLTEWGASSGAALLWGMAAGAAEAARGQTREPPAAACYCSLPGAVVSPSTVRGSPPPTTICTRCGVGCSGLGMRTSSTPLSSAAVTAPA